MDLTFKPTVFWAWNSEMTEDEIRDALQEFQSQGIGGVFVHARAGLEIGYLSEEWFKAFDLALSECKKYGIELWIYDEYGWPSGQAGGSIAKLSDDYTLKHLTLSNLAVNDQSYHLIASYRNEGKRFVLDGNKPDFYIYYVSEPHYVDLLNPDVVTVFLASTHEEYFKRYSSEFGKTIKGVFTDEPQIHVSDLAYSTVVPSAFMLDHGYDFKDGLPYLFDLGDRDKAISYRYQYYLTVRRLFVTNYTERVSNWCQDHQLIFTGHFAGEEGQVIQAASNVGVMPHYFKMGMIGIDSLGKRLNTVVLMKQAESVANQVGKNRILSEVFACTGNGVTFRELKKIWGYHLSFGINFPCMSISMTALGGARKRDYPVFISKEQPWWPSFSYFAKWVNQAGQMTVKGNREPDVLLLSPIDSVIYTKIFDPMGVKISSDFRRINEILTDLNIDYDIGEESSLSEKAKVSKGSLVIGKEHYQIVILPEEAGIRKTTLKLLKKFKKAGGRIIQMESFPEYLDGRKTKTSSSFLKENVDALLSIRKEIVSRYFNQISYQRKLTFLNEDGRLESGLIYRILKAGDDYNFTVFNPGDEEKTTMVSASKSGFFKENDFMNNSSLDITTYKTPSMTTGKITVKGGEFKAYSFTQRVIKKTGEKLRRIDYLPFSFLGFDSLNTLVIDNAKSSIVSEEELPVIELSEKLFQKAEALKRVLNAEVIYHFNYEGGEIKDISLETDGLMSLSINGHKLWEKGQQVPSERLRDCSFKSFKVGDVIRDKDNEISLVYEVRPLSLGFDLKTVHESERNKFNYPTSIEAIYLTGYFDLTAKNIEQTVKVVKVDPPLSVVKPKEKKNGDIVSQGSFFYTGNVSYVAQIPYKLGKLSLIPHFYGIGVLVYLNGKLLGLSDGNNGISLPRLEMANNELKLTVLGSLRNMLGPLHHFMGEVEYTGVNTFTGGYGNGAIEDLSNEGKTDRLLTPSYQLLRQGLESIELISMEESDE